METTARPRINRFTITWHPEDVQEIRPDLTNEQAQEVLWLARKFHDANVGVNWDVLSIWAEQLYPEPEDSDDEEGGAA